MIHSHSAAYAAAGVDIEAGYQGVKLMKQHVQRTFIPGVVSDIGGFGGLFAPDFSGMKEPFLNHWETVKSTVSLWLPVKNQPC